MLFHEYIFSGTISPTLRIVWSHTEHTKPERIEMRRSIKSNSICASVALLSVTAVYLVSGTNPARGQSESRDIVDTAVAAGDFDSVLLPQPMSPRQAMRILEDAIRRGVPVFNGGDHRECAEIYTAACQAITESGSDQLPPSVMTALKTALSRAKQMQDAPSQAWALRNGMDSARGDLREASPTNTSMAEDKERLLFTFDKPEAAGQWQTTNDGVMGGRSDGRFKINEDENMLFFGTLSLENNGGFASVRSRGSNLGLQKGDSIVARVRGDGREYSLNLYTPRRRMAYSYRATFKTRKDEWIEVRIPLDKFVATSFGRVIRNQELDPSAVNGLGVLLGDKKAGPFELEIDWIKVFKTS